MARPTEMSIILITASLVEPRRDRAIKRAFVTHQEQISLSSIERLVDGPYFDSNAVPYES